jgi:phosphoglycerate dehydrogenase-like enzyme
MKKIALAGEFNFTDEQKARLAAVGQVDDLSGIKTNEEWVERVTGYDVICTWGDFVLDNIDKLENTLVTYPYTELGVFDSEQLAKKNVFVANAKGGNRKSIVEWTMFMVLALFREFPKYVRTATEHPFTAHESLEGKKVVIVGHGTIGSEVGERCAAFGMEVSYFERGGDLHESVKDADVVVDALNCNSSTKNLLDADFFMSMKKGADFVTFARPWTYDIDGLIKAIDEGVVAGAGIDCDPEPLFDITNEFYKKCMTNEKILVTPHVAGITTQASKNGIEIMVQNVEGYLNGVPKNLISKI